MANISENVKKDGLFVFEKIGNIFGIVFIGFWLVFGRVIRGVFTFIIGAVGLYIFLGLIGVILCHVLAGLGHAYLGH